jgi:hypothetical protein
MTSPTAQPASIDALVDHLTSSGFRLVREDRGGMGGVLLVYEGTADGLPASVEITADRGQWQALLKFDGMRTSVLPEIWTAYLDGADAHDMTVDDQVKFIRDRLADAATTFRQDPKADGILTEIGHAHADRILTELRKSFDNP